MNKLWFTFLISWFRYRTILVPFGARPYLCTSTDIDVTPSTEKSKRGSGYLHIIINWHYQIGWHKTNIHACVHTKNAGKSFMWNQQKMKGLVEAKKNKKDDSIYQQKMLALSQVTTRNSSKMSSKWSKLYTITYQR